MNYNNSKSGGRSIHTRNVYAAGRQSHKYGRSRQRHMLLGIFIVVLMICSGSVLFHKTISSASTEFPREKCFMSVEIQPGDSLWSIASEHFTEEWDNIENYIEEIKEFNGIYCEEIRSGGLLDDSILCRRGIE